MKTIFFLDDSEDFLEIAKIFVETSGDYRALTSKSYDETLTHEDEVLHSDVAFLDINLGPNSPSGIQVFRWLRQKGYSHPIYFLTGHAKNSAEVQAAQAEGNVSVLTKPFSPEKLLQLIGAS